MEFDGILAATDPLLSAEQMRASDEFTIQSLGVPGIALMEHAGRAVADAVASLRGPVLPDMQPGASVGKIVVLCGPGNNGGDGYVAARHLASHGFDVEVFAMRAADALKGDAKVAAVAWKRFCEHAPDRALSTWVAPTDENENETESMFLDGLAAELRRTTAVVDALFGIGLSRPLNAIAQRMVETVNQAGCPVVAVDIPSGLPSDGASPEGPTIIATQTVTFFEKKMAHVSEPGVAACGQVRVVDVTIRRESSAPIKVRALRPAAGRFEPAKTASRLAHKGKFGHVGVVAGTRETAGAARLAARASLRAGSGLCTILEEPGALSHSADLVEVMRREFTASEAIAAWDKLSAVVVGPGLGLSKAALEKGRAILMARSDRPCVVDADLFAGLFGHEIAPSTRAEVIDAGEGTLVFTPHPKEAGFIIGDTSAADVQSNRLEAAVTLVDKCPQAVWVLKGAVPIVAFKDWRVLIPGGNPALAVAGSGDVLAGVIAGHLAMHPKTKAGAFSAAIEGCRRHQQAGARFARRGALASEIADAIAETPMGALA